MRRDVNRRRASTGTKIDLGHVRLICTLAPRTIIPCTHRVPYAYAGRLRAELSMVNGDPALRAPSREFIYSDSVPGSGLVATIAGGSSPTTTYFHDDQLSWRVSTDGTSGSPTYGQVIGQQGSYPFGQSWYSSNGNEFAFTTYQRDSESGLDYAMVRYYDSSAARFCSADPVGGKFDDPQTWDRYTYVRNDPIDLTDPNGQSWWSDLLDVLAVALTFILPEVAPAEFSLLGSTAATATDATTGSFAWGTLAGTNIPAIVGTATLQSRSSVAFGITIGGAAVGGQTTPSQSAKQQAQQPQLKKDCPQVPPHPPGADVNANIRATSATDAKAAITQTPRVRVFQWWANQVAPHAPWDYKDQPHGFQLYDDFGNFNYGATGSVLGIPNTTLFQGAAFARYGANIVDGRNPFASLQRYGSPFKGPNYGNDVHKNEMIRQGIKYQQNGCGNS